MPLAAPPRRAELPSALRARTQIRRGGSARAAPRVHYWLRLPSGPDPDHALGGGAKRAPRGGIVGLGVGLRLAQDIEIAAGDRIEGRVGDQTSRGFDPL